jgi:hypothetical protein
VTNGLNEGLRYHVANNNASVLNATGDESSSWPNSGSAAAEAGTATDKYSWSTLFPQDENGPRALGSVISAGGMSIVFTEACQELASTVYHHLVKVPLLRFSASASYVCLCMCAFLCRTRLGRF